MVKLIGGNNMEKIIINLNNLEHYENVLELLKIKSIFLKRKSTIKNVLNDIYELQSKLNTFYIYGE
jgi:hypothetical protein